MKKILYYNTQLILEDSIILGAVAVNNQRIEHILEHDSLDLSDFDTYERIDLEGNYLAPGFIDIHLHGGGGFDFMDGTVEAFEQIAKTHARYGTTAIVPTTLTTTHERLIETLEAYEAVSKSTYDGARLLGIHLEGPYFAMSQKGAQDPRYIRNPDPKEYIPLIEKYASIVRWSIAPELDGALEMGSYLQSKGIVAAIAHTDAVYEDVVKAHEVGYSLMTHFYSAMSGVTRKNAFRYAGVVEAGYLIDAFDVELIADGIHLPAPLLNLIYKIKGKDRMILITDAMRAAGTDVKRSILGSMEDGLEVLIENGVAKLPDRTAFAGSVATADRLIRTMLQNTSIPLVEIVQMLTLNPARVMKVHETTGSIAIGKYADLVAFDKAIDIKRTIVQGREVYGPQ